MSIRFSWNIWFAGALLVATVLAAAFEQPPMIILSLCLVLAVCFAIKTMIGEKDF